MPIYDELPVSDLAWAAGFIDGEGTISLYGRSDRLREYRVTVTAVNTNRIALDRLRAMFGGTVHLMHKDTPGRNWKPSFYWAISYGKAAEAIKLLLPFLLLKRPQAELALEARTHVGCESGRKRSESRMQALQAICNRFRSLNRKGKG